MYSNYSDQCRRLVFAMLAMLMLVLAQPARAADYTAGVAVVDNKTVLWFQGASITQSIAHYNVAGGAQQNVGMAFNASRARYELVVPATNGQTVNHSFTYTKAGLAYDTPWAASIVGPGEPQVAAPTFSPPAGNYASAQQVTVSSATAGAAVQCALNGGAMAPCASPLTISANTTVTAMASLAGMANSATASAAYTIGPDSQGQGVIDNGATLTLWFSRSPQAAWVDAHFNLNSTGQQNVRMALAGARYQLSIPVAASGPATLSYSFTFMSGSGAQDSAVFNWTRPTKVATPKFSPAPGAYSSAQSVAITSDTVGATVRYTLDGSVASAGSTIYAGPITVNAPGVTINAIALKSGMEQSNNATGAYTVTLKAATPVMSPPAGAYLTAQNVTLTSATAGATIRYTLDGSTPGATSTLYSGAFAVAAPGKTIKAIALKSGMGNSNVASAAYVIDGTVAAPVFTPAPGTYAGTQNVTLASATAGATIRYTLDGATPGATSTLYSGAIAVAAPGKTIKAIALKSGMKNSAVSTGAYVIAPEEVRAPVFSPPAGAYAAAQSVALSSGTIGAAIRYTLDGTVPTATSTLYGSAIAVAAPGKTIKAIAVKNGVLSPVASAAYQIGPVALAHGVVEDGATARIWNKPPTTPTTNIVHYYITTKAGVKGAQRDENMVYDQTAQRWHGPTISPIASGSTIAYFFTYTSSNGGNIDSAWFEYTLCELDCVEDVPKPVFTPATGGKVAAGTQVRLSLGTGSVAGTKIYYTLDGKAPTIASPVYAGTPVTINSAVTINAIAMQPDGLTSRRASLTFDVLTICDTQPLQCPVATPTLSHAGGEYATKIGVNMLTETTGATVHYTIDGSTPSATSPQFHGAIWFFKDPVKGDTFTLKAIATKDGRDSNVASATYKILSNPESLWDGKTVFNVVNGTGGKYRDDQIYWFIIGKDWATGQFVRADATGKLIPVSEADNTIPVPDRDKGYANYSITLAQAKSVVIPPIESARIYMSVGKPVIVQINRDINGKIGYAGPNLENSTDPNLDVQFDFGEFNINRPRPASDYPGIFVNTTRVDIFGFPLKLRVTGLDGYDATVGETLKETRDELMARFILETPSEFHGLAKAPYAPNRIMAPAHGTFKADGPNATYLDAYIGEIWDMYRSRDLVMKVGDWPTFRGRVGPDNVMTFTDGIDTYKINGKPTTQEVMLGNGVLDDARGTTPGTEKYNKQLQLQAQLCAALNRHVAEQPNERWYNAAYFYPEGSTANWFTKFWHEHSYNGLAYGFSYDDVGGHSPSIYTPAPTSVTYTIGK